MMSDLRKLFLSSINTVLLLIHNFPYILHILQFYCISYNVLLYIGNKFYPLFLIQIHFYILSISFFMNTFCTSNHIFHILLHLKTFLQYNHYILHSCIQDNLRPHRNFLSFFTFLHPLSPFFSFTYYY